MASWQRHIYLQPHWDCAQDGTISINELSRVIAGHLKSLRPFGNEFIDNMKDELVEEFEWLAKSTEVTRDDFDNWMSQLYDWGDIHISGGFFDAKKVCWIDVISSRPRAKSQIEEPHSGDTGTAEQPGSSLTQKTVRA